MDHALIPDPITKCRPKWDFWMYERKPSPDGPSPSIGGRFMHDREIITRCSRRPPNSRSADVAYSKATTII